MSQGIPEVAEAIAAIDGVSEVYSVTGQVDLIVMVRVRRHEDVADVVADQVNKVAGVTSTETHIAFRAYSRHDLESAFALGLDCNPVNSTCRGRSTTTVGPWARSRSGNACHVTSSCRGHSSSPGIPC